MMVLRRRGPFPVDHVDKRAQDLRSRIARKILPGMGKDKSDGGGVRNLFPCGRKR